jgi:hypothetical protein
VLSIPAAMMTEMNDRSAGLAGSLAPKVVQDVAAIV